MVAIFGLSPVPEPAGRRGARSCGSASHKLPKNSAAVKNAYVLASIAEPKSSTLGRKNLFIARSGENIPRYDLAAVELIRKEHQHRVSIDVVERDSNGIRFL